MLKEAYISHLFYFMLDVWMAAWCVLGVSECGG